MPRHRAAGAASLPQPTETGLAAGNIVKVARGRILQPTLGCDRTHFGYIQYNGIGPVWKLR